MFGNINKFYQHLFFGSCLFLISINNADSKGHHMNQNITTEIKPLTEEPCFKPILGEGVSLCHPSIAQPSAATTIATVATVASTPSTVAATKATAETTTTSKPTTSTTKPTTSTTKPTTSTTKPATSVPSTKTTSTLVPDTHKTETTESESLVVPNNTKFGTTKSAALAAGLCVAIALTGYVSLMVWRKVQMNRYGNTELLLNEDDVADIHDEDMKHFEAACIQIEAD